MDYKQKERHQAVCRGLQFIYQLASDPEIFSTHGSDLLSCFDLSASRSRNPTVRSLALSMGRERALQWRRDTPKLPKNANADEIAEFVQGTDAADRLGVRDKALKTIIKQAAAQFSATDYLWFDPHIEPPPSDIPEQCRCGLWNDRGSKTCRKCKRRLDMINRYWIWYFALTRASIGESYGVRLGSSYPEVLKWISRMRPYSISANGGANPDFYDMLYATTHVVYTLNDYNRYKLSRRWLPGEFQFLKESVREAIAQSDVEMLGEVLDSLKGFGLGNRNPLLKLGIDYLLKQQNRDGSWGEKTKNTYQTYHTTWTVIDGLRDYAWQGPAPLSSRIMKLLHQSK